MESKKTEQQIQTKIIKQLTKEGWYVIKLIKTSKNGIMDLLCHRQGQTMYIEVKRPEGVLSELQKIRIIELKKQNIDVRVWTDYNTEFHY